MCVRQCDVLKCLRKVKSKAEGLDGISPKFMKFLLPLVLSHITHIMSTAITTSTFPSAWKFAKIVPIPKSQTEFRPISLLPFLSKIFENILAAQIQPFMNIISMLSEKQSGFRKNRSFICAITDVVEDIRSKASYKHSKAFDTVNHSVLCTKLRNLFNFSDSVVLLLRSYLTDRQQAVVSGFR